MAKKLLSRKLEHNHNNKWGKQNQKNHTPQILQVFTVHNKMPAAPNNRLAQHRCCPYSE